MRKGNVLTIAASLIFQTQMTACTEYEHSNNKLFLLLKDKNEELVNCLMLLPVMERWPSRGCPWALTTEITENTHGNHCMGLLCPGIFHQQSPLIIWERILNSLDFDLTQYCSLDVIKFWKIVIVHCLFLKSSFVKDLAVWFFHSFPLSFIELPKAQKPSKKVTCFPLQKVRF